MALIFVTGARGAIGRRVVAFAQGRGHRVCGLGHGAWLDDGGLPSIEGWINGDVNSDNLTALATQFGSPDSVVHLAGGSLVGPSISHPGEDFRRTVEGSQRLLLWLRTDAPLARLVIASSAAVYGDGHHYPISENAPLNPTSPYGTHKAVVEMLCRSYARDFSLNVAILRLFSVYGPGLQKQLIWDLASRIHRGEAGIVLGGLGKETRDFIYIDDAANMLLDVVEQAEASVPVLNGCTGRATSITAIAGLVSKAFGAPSPEFSGLIRTGDPLHLTGNIDLSRATGLQAGTPLEDGLAETLTWIQKRLSKEIAL